METPFNQKVEYGDDDGAARSCGDLRVTERSRVRRAIVDRFAEGDATVNELAALFPISLQAVSKHIKVLETAGVVSRRKEAQTHPVHPEASSLARSSDWLEAHRGRLDHIGLPTS